MNKTERDTLRIIPNFGAYIGAVMRLADTIGQSPASILVCSGDGAMLTGDRVAAFYALQGLSAYPDHALNPYVLNVNAWCRAN